MIAFGWEVVMACHKLLSIMELNTHSTAIINWSIPGTVFDGITSYFF